MFLRCLFLCHSYQICYIISTGWQLLVAVCMLYRMSHPPSWFFVSIYAVWVQFLNVMFLVSKRSLLVCIQHGMSYGVRCVDELRVWWPFGFFSLNTAVSFVCCMQFALHSTAAAMLHVFFGLFQHDTVQHFRSLSLCYHVPVKYISCEKYFAATAMDDAICSTTVPVEMRLHWFTELPACMGRLRRDGQCCGPGGAVWPAH